MFIKHVYNIECTFVFVCQGESKVYFQGLYCVNLTSLKFSREGGVRIPDLPTPNPNPPFDPHM